jgi:hypothetical protein
MQKKRPWMATVTLGAVASAFCAAQAAGIGSGPGSVVLGQPLNYAVPVRLEPGETLGAECVSAEVSLGDRRLPPGLVRVAVEPTGLDAVRIRVLTSLVMDEPVVSVQVNAGCGARVSRRYVVLVDPPAALQAIAVAPAFAAAPPELQPAQPSAAPVEGNLRPVDPASASSSSDGLIAPTGSARTVALRERPRVSSSTRGARRAETRAAKRRTPSSAVARTEAPRRTAARREVESAPRLRLDYSAPSVANGSAVDQALEAVAQAAVAARQSASAASAAAERIAALEKTVEQLRGDAKGSRDQSAQLREQLARADSAGTRSWMLALAAAALAALAAWLGMRLSAARRSHNEAWQVAARQAGAGGSPSGIPSVLPALKAGTTTLDGADSVPGQPVLAPRTRPAPAWPPPAPVEPWSPYASGSGGASAKAAPAAPARPAVTPVAASRPEARPPASQASGATRQTPSMLMQPAAAPAIAATESLSPTQVTLALPSIHRLEATGPRDVSIDELLDLEQQAEFFVVLGQDDAAIDLLVEHLRHTGGGSPLPYLKLLEIYRRRGDLADYERTRSRFNHRFNAYAPEWEVDLQSGRALVDYPGVLPRLQRAWPRPLDSMAELEALLFRKTRGELFDLPAYREVLFLYSLARDLLDRESADTGQVDLLLPMPSENDFSSTAPAPYLELGRDSQHGHVDFEERPTSPVDLDLTLDSDRPTSIFDPLDERPQHSRRR